MTVFQRRNNVSLSTLNQRRNLTLKQRWFWVDHKTIFVLMLQWLRNFNLYINVEEITVFQRRNNVILSTLKQHQNLTLKQRWFWVDTKTNFVLLYQQTQHVESMSKFRRHVNVNEFLRHFDMLFWCNFDGRIIDVILMYIFDIILMHGKSTQLQRAYFVVL